MDPVWTARGSSLDPQRRILGKYEIRQLNTGSVDNLSSMKAFVDPDLSGGIITPSALTQGQLNSGSATRSFTAQNLLKEIADRWVVLILMSVADGGKRYGEIQAMVEGISQKVLSQRLATLTRLGMLTRTSHPETPPRVVYALTEMGESAVPSARALMNWVEEQAAQ